MTDWDKERRRNKIIELFDRNALLLKQRMEILDIYHKLLENKQKIKELEKELLHEKVKEPHRIKIEL